MTRLAVLGPTGRMGAMVCQLATASKHLSLHSAIEAAGTDAVGTSLCGITITDDLGGAIAAADVYIDFTTPTATAAAARAAARGRTAAVIGTTGLDEAATSAIDALADAAPVLVAANFSLGVNVLMILAELAARALGDGFDLEVVEMHHRHKRDSPSGTALALGHALARGREWQLDDVQRLSRQGNVGARPDREIGFATLRGGGVVGDHTVVLASEQERVELGHRAETREVFAAGSLRAAEWLAGKSPGRYTMRDVLGL